MPLPIIQTLASSSTREMLERAQDNANRARKMEAERRVLILQGNWTHMVHGYIGRIYKSEKVKSALRRRVKKTTDLFGLLCDRVCVTYDVPPTRELENAPDAVQAAFTAVLKEGQLDTSAEMWERYMFGANVFYVVPQVRGDRLHYMELLPHCTDVYFPNGDQTQDPEHVVYSVRDPSDYTDRPLSWVILDVEAYRYYDDNGRLLRVVPHGAGVMPAQQYRARKAIDNDHWDSHRGEGVVEAHIEVAHLATRLDWVRHGQDRKKELLASERLDQIPVQIAGAEGPVEIPVPQDEVSWQVLDLNTPPDDIIKHIRFWSNKAADAIGVPLELVELDAGATDYGNVTGIAAARQQAALESVRRKNRKRLDESEAKLHWRTAHVLRGGRHPAARRLEPSRIRETLRITHAARPFIDHPKTQAEVWKLWIDLGVMSTYEVYRQAFPGTTPRQARERVQQVALEEAELDKFYIDHGLPKDAELRRKSREQLLGTIGGMRSGQTRRGEAPNDNPEPGRVE